MPIIWYNKVPLWIKHDAQPNILNPVSQSYIMVYIQLMFNLTFMPWSNKVSFWFESNIMVGLIFIIWYNKVRLWTKCNVQCNTSNIIQQIFILFWSQFNLTFGLIPWIWFNIVSFYFGSIFGPMPRIVQI